MLLPCKALLFGCPLVHPRFSVTPDPPSSKIRPLASLRPSVSPTHSLAGGRPLCWLALCRPPVVRPSRTPLMASPFTRAFDVGARPVDSVGALFALVPSTTQPLAMAFECEAGTSDAAADGTRLGSVHHLVSCMQVCECAHHWHVLGVSPNHQGPAPMALDQQSAPATVQLAEGGKASQHQPWSEVAA